MLSSSAKMSSLSEESNKYKRSADKLLKSSNLLKILEKYGEITFVGSYAAGLMMHGDIDIHVLRNKEFSKKDTLNIFNKIVSLTKFNSYYIGDWNNSNLHPQFPYGYYIGLKTRKADINWKIDIWLVSIAEQKRFDKKYMDVTKIKLTSDKREAILKFKKYRQENSLKISGQKIYAMVINKNITKLSDFKKKHL